MILFRFFLTLLVSAIALDLSAASPSKNTPETIQNLQFTPPAEWRNAESTELPKHVHLMVVGKGANEFPPSISIATEPYSGTLKQYLKRIKELNASKGFEWKDLGNIKTEAGNASLSQADSKSQWGEIRMLHVIFKKNDTIYIVNAAALKNEFPKFYKEIFAALRSLKFAETDAQ